MRLPIISHLQWSAVTCLVVKYKLAHTSLTNPIITILNCRPNLTRVRSISVGSTRRIHLKLNAIKVHWQRLTCIEFRRRQGCCPRGSFIGRILIFGSVLVISIEWVVTVKNVVDLILACWWYHGPLCLTILRRAPLALLLGVVALLLNNSGNLIILTDVNHQLKKRPFDDVNIQILYPFKVLLDSIFNK